MSYHAKQHRMLWQPRGSLCWDACVNIISSPRTYSGSEGRLGAGNICPSNAVESSSQMDNTKPGGSGADPHLHLLRPESSPCHLRNQHSMCKVPGMSSYGSTDNVELAYRACLQTPYTSDPIQSQRLTERVVSPVKSTADTGTPPRIRSAHRTRSLKLHNSCSPRKTPTEVKAMFEPQIENQITIRDNPEADKSLRIMRMPGVACQLFCIDDTSSPDTSMSPLDISILSDDDSDNLSQVNHSGFEGTSQIYDKVESVTNKEVVQKKRPVYSKPKLNRYFDTITHQNETHIYKPEKGKFENEFMVGKTLEAKFFKEAVEKILRNLKDDFDSVGQKDLIIPICGTKCDVSSSVSQGNDHHLAEERPPGESNDTHGSTELEGNSTQEISKSEIIRRRRKLDDIDLISRIGCIFQEFHLNYDLTLLPKNIHDEHHVMCNALDQTIPESDYVTDHVVMLQLEANLYRLTSGELAFDIPVF